MNSTWQTKDFSSLNTNELYDILKLRIDIFVVEQTCYYPDLDDLDRHPQTLHLFKYIDGELAAYLRILAKGTSYPEHISIGRVVISPNFRGRALGHELIRQSLEEVKTNFPDQPLKISAQEHLQGFYQQHNFETVGDMYLEDDIPHVAMIHRG